MTGGALALAALAWLVGAALLGSGLGHLIRNADRESSHHH